MNLRHAYFWNKGESSSPSTFGFMETSTPRPRLPHHAVGQLEFGSLRADEQSRVWEASTPCGDRQAAARPAHAPAPLPPSGPEHSRTRTPPLGGSEVGTPGTQVRPYFSPKPAAEVNPPPPALVCAEQRARQMLALEPEPERCTCHLRGSPGRCFPRQYQSCTHV